MQLQFLALVELFFKQLNGCSFLTQAEFLFFDIQFSRRAVCHVYTFIKNGTFNHCGRSKAWNSTHHGRNTDMYIYARTYTIMYTYRFKIHVQKHVRVRGWVVWCGVVWCVVVVVSLSLVFSNLKLVRSKGFFR